MMDKAAGRLKWNEKITYFIITNAELFFYHVGRTVALKPKLTIFITCLLVLLSGLGVFRFRVERNPLKLWVPRKSSFTMNSDWLMGTFERGIRTEAVILEAPDVLIPEVFRELAWIDKEVKGLVSSKGDKYEDLCPPIPKISPTDELVNKIKFTCSLLDFLEYTCYEQNIIELWDYNWKELQNLTKEDILYRVNKYKKHPVFDNLKIYEDLLGGVVKNETGHIISATHLHTMWLLNVNYTAINIEETGNAAGTSDFASEESLLWEVSYLDLMKVMKKNVRNVTMYYFSARSFGDISNESMFQDFDILVVGVCIVIVYIQVVLSKCNWVEIRVFISFIGFTTIALAFAAGCGIATLCGIPYSIVHTTLPFLLLGIGIDDMFVILSCWDHLTEEQKKLPIHESVGAMLKHAGLSITITTLTDVVAFLIGSLTVIPSLQAYCLYAALCLITTFVLTCTFFVACFTFDVKRISSNRNCCLMWKKHDNYKNGCDQKDIFGKAFEFLYSRAILTWPGKLFVILIVIIMTGFSIKGILNLEQRFDPLWFIPSHTYLSHYMEVRATNYPSLGHEASLFIGAVNYTHEFKNIKVLNDKLENHTGINSINSWVMEYQKFVLDNYGINIYEEVLPENDFHLYLSEFLFRNGSQFQANFQFEKQLRCGFPAPKIEAAGINFRFRHFSGPEEHVPAMRQVIDMEAANNFTTGDRRSFVWSIIFATWIMDEVIDMELARNIILALACVMLCTVILIADFQVCFWIFICVLITITNVAGFMQKWGITIDITSCIALQLAIGLCVDYATHIGYTFLTIVGDNREKRSLKTVVTIGAAVMNGGMSTLIAVLMLSFSDSYSFTVFFKLFFMVTTFGLFNGIVLLPVILSWIGPPPYRSHQLLEQNEFSL